METAIIIILCIVLGWFFLTLFWFFFYTMYLEIKYKKLDIEEKERRLNK